MNNFTLMYNIGDTICINGVHYRVVSVHLYISDNCFTQRYYLGGGLWVTIR